MPVWTSSCELTLCAPLIVMSCTIRSYMMHLDSLCMYTLLCRYVQTVRVICVCICLCTRIYSGRLCALVQNTYQVVLIVLQVIPRMVIFHHHSSSFSTFLFSRSPILQCGAAVKRYAPFPLYIPSLPLSLSFSPLCISRQTNPDNDRLFPANTNTLNASVRFCAYFSAPRRTLWNQNWSRGCILRTHYRWNRDFTCSCTSHLCTECVISRTGN